MDRARGLERSSRSSSSCCWVRTWVRETRWVGGPLGTQWLDLRNGCFIGPPPSESSSRTSSSLLRWISPPKTVPAHDGPRHPVVNFPDGQSPVTSLAPRVPPVHSSPDTGVTLVSHSRHTRVTPASPLLAASTGGRPLMAERVNGGRPLPPVRCLRPVSIRSNVLPVRNCLKYEHASSHLSSVSVVAFSA